MSSGTVEHLAQMANDIGAYFKAEPSHDDAVAGIVNHMKKFWTPRMRQKLIEHVRNGGNSLDELPLEAVRKLASG